MFKTTRHASSKSDCGDEYFEECDYVKEENKSFPDRMQKHCKLYSEKRHITMQVLKI